MSDAQDTPPIAVQQVDQVNIGTPVGTHLPYVWILAGVTGAILGGFAAVTFWVLVGAAGHGIDAATKGALIQTWNNLALLAAGFWLGSSLAGKMSSKPVQQ